MSGPGGDDSDATDEEGVARTETVAANEADVAAAEPPETATPRQEAALRALLKASGWRKKTCADRNIWKNAPQ